MSPFFILMKRIILNPAVHFITIIVGTFIIIEAVHLDAHKNAKEDVHSYVREYLKNDSSICNTY